MPNEDEIENNFYRFSKPRTGPNWRKEKLDPNDEDFRDSEYMIGFNRIVDSENNTIQYI